MNQRPGCDAAQAAPLGGDSLSSFYRDFNRASLFFFPFTIATVITSPLALINPCSHKTTKDYFF